jgi:PPP family 3-phenylpropionic acid transporter
MHGSHAFYYAFGTLHWQAQGLGAGLIGALWATGVVAEIALFSGAAAWWPGSGRSGWRWSRRAAARCAGR